jgi:hypothetical protein
MELMLRAKPQGPQAPSKPSRGSNLLCGTSRTPRKSNSTPAFDIQTPASVSVSVDPTQVYLLFVEANVDGQGVGWPGSLAGSVLSVTVPSISYDFRMRQVLEPYVA